MKGSNSEPAPPLCLVAAAQGKVARLLGFVKNLRYDSLSIDGYLVVNCKSLWRGHALLFPALLSGLHITHQESQSVIHHHK